MTYAITANEELNSIEIAFDGKPSAAVREALKALKFRWHGIKKIWYGFAEAEELRRSIEQADGESLTESIEQPKQAKQPKKSGLASLWERCDVSALPGYGTENKIKKTAREEARKAGGSYDKYAAAYIRKHLKARFPEMKFSVTSGGAGWLNACDVVIKAGPYSRHFIKGNGDWNSRNQYDHWENSDELNAVYNYCKALFNVFDADDGDYYADYGAHHDLYGGVSIDSGYTQTAPTAEQAEAAADFADRKAEAEAIEREREEAEFKARCEELERQKKELAEAERQAEQNHAEIMQHVTVEDLSEEKQIAVIGLLSDYGKAGTVSRALEQIAERIEDGEQVRTDAIITRKVKFTDERIYTNFWNLLMWDFEFLSGKGGTATEDPRLTDSEQLFKLNDEQRESVKFYNSDCIGVYLNDVFMFVINPEGYTYARYTLHPDDETDSYPAPVKLSQWRATAETKEAFYFPAPLSKQLPQADLQAGEAVTMIYVNGWTMGVEHVTGKLNSTPQPTRYAQYEDAAAFDITPNGKRQPERIYIYNGKNAVIYKGELPDVPHEIKYTDLGGNLEQVNFAGEFCNEYLKNVIRYYAKLGHLPVIDTFQR